MAHATYKHQGGIDTPSVPPVFYLVLERYLIDTDAVLLYIWRLVLIPTSLQSSLIRDTKRGAFMRAFYYLYAVLAGIASAMIVTRFVAAWKLATLMIEVQKKRRQIEHLKEMAKSLWEVDGRPVIKDDHLELRMRHKLRKRWKEIISLPLQGANDPRLLALQDGDDLELELVMDETSDPPVVQELRVAIPSLMGANLQIQSPAGEIRPAQGSEL